MRDRAHEQGQEITRLLRAWNQGDDGAFDTVAPLVYEELRRLAHHLMRGERANHLLQTTALVHEAYLRLVGIDLDSEDRGHFYRVAARQMRRVLVDDARRRRARKRDGGHEVPLDRITVGTESSFEVLALDQAIENLAAIDGRKAEIIELRYFGGLKVDEVATVTGLSRATVERDLKLARAWLRRALGPEGTVP